MFIERGVENKHHITGVTDEEHRGGGDKGLSDGLDRGEEEEEGI